MNTDSSNDQTVKSEPVTDGEDDEKTYFEVPVTNSFVAIQNNPKISDLELKKSSSNETFSLSSKSAKKGKKLSEIEFAHINIPNPHVKQESSEYPLNFGFEIGM